MLFTFQLECQCISAISIGGPKTTSGEGESGGDGKMKDILDLPIWIMAINIVAMEMLRTKLPPPPSEYHEILFEKNHYYTTVLDNF